MANADIPNGFRYKSGAAGGQPVIKTKTVATSQTIAEGDAVILNASGLVEIAVATSGQIYGVAHTSCSSAAAGTQIQIIPAVRTYVFEGQCSGTLTQAIIGTAVDIEGTTGIMEINENTTVEQVALVLELAPDVENTLGANSRVLFSWVRSQYELLLAAV